MLSPLKGIIYQKVCGLASGYQKGAPDAFLYGGFDGLSITRGNPRQHIWSYAMGIDSGMNP